jgi:hypothetical protein
MGWLKRLLGLELDHPQSPVSQGPNRSQRVRLIHRLNTHQFQSS